MRWMLIEVHNLSVRTERTGAPLVVREARKEPLQIEEWQVDLDRKNFGAKFKMERQLKMQLKPSSRTCGKSFQPI